MTVQDKKFEISTATNIKCSCMDDEIVAEFATKEAAHGIRLDTPPAKLVAV
jgi:hypothetical protein